MRIFIIHCCQVGWFHFIKTRHRSSEKSKTNRAVKAASTTQTPEPDQEPQPFALTSTSLQLPMERHMPGANFTTSAHTAPPQFNAATLKDVMFIVYGSVSGRRAFLLRKIVKEDPNVEMYVGDRRKSSTPPIIS
jgi:hypothetical protein